ncbi:MAG: Zn-ribbon domain-containing OB-fold protein [Candidatus Bathyarchaeia archaeon]
MSVPRYWREIKPRYRLQGEECIDCGAKLFPATPVCPECGCREFREYKLPESGILLSWTIIKNPPAGYQKYSPYLVGLVDLGDGIKILSQIVDVSSEEIEFGMPVRAVFRKVREDGSSGIIEYGYKFRPPVE